MRPSNDKFELAPIQILGVAIMLLTIVLGAVYAFAVAKPMAIRKIQAGTWTIWDEILDKLIIVAIGCVGYFGYMLRVLPEEGWSWRRAFRSGLEAVIAGALFGLMYSLSDRLGLW